MTNTELTQEEINSIEETVKRRNLIMQNLLDVQKMKLAYLLEKERIDGIARAKKKRKAVVKRKAAKVARKVNRRNK